MQDLVNFIQYSEMANPQYAIAFPIEPRIAKAIRLCAQCMLTTVDFNDEISIKTYEVSDIWSNHLLSSELVPVKLPIAQSFPKSALRKTGCLSKRARASRCGHVSKL